MEEKQASKQARQSAKRARHKVKLKALIQAGRIAQTTQELHLTLERAYKELQVRHTEVTAEWQQKFSDVSRDFAQLQIKYAAVVSGNEVLTIRSQQTEQALQETSVLARTLETRVKYLEAQDYDSKSLRERLRKKSEENQVLKDELNKLNLLVKKAEAATVRSILAQREIQERFAKKRAENVKVQEPTPPEPQLSSEIMP